MTGFLDIYQNLPLKINPIAVQVGFFSIGWYPLMYIAAFVTVYLLLQYRIKCEEVKGQKFQVFIASRGLIEDLFFYAIIGALLGGRLGYWLFYDFRYFLNHPWELFWPFDQNGNFIGLYGMSYYGGLLGIVISALFLVKKYKINFWQLADFVVPAIPAGYFFGRIGNFLNLELYGKPTDKPWGMYFFDGYDYLLRHPNQLYEAFLEGILLFAILWSIRNREKLRGLYLSFYLIGYGIIRFFMEFLRDTQSLAGAQFQISGINLTLSQIFSVSAALIGLIFMFYKYSKKNYNKGK